LKSEDIASFRREARVVASLIHPNIVRVLDFGIEHQTPFLVMDFAPHGTVRQRYPRGTLLPVPAVVSYTRQVADALQFAHDERVIHRDVKPENLLLGRRHEILLSDFGIAVLTHRPDELTPYNTAGTLRYMAPEQLQGQPSPASDQYALAVVVYEWLCGKCPFEGSSAMEVAMQHISQPPQPLRELIPTTPAVLEQVVLKALAKDPQQRFDSIQDFAESLERAISSEAFNTSPPPKTEPPETPPNLSDDSSSTLPINPLDESPTNNGV
jgi:serine/threonine protein kinase